MLLRKHFAAFAALQFFGSYRTNNGHHRTLVRRGSVAIDPKAALGRVENPHRSEPLTRCWPIGYAGSLARGSRMQFDQLKRRDFITLMGGTAVA